MSIESKIIKCPHCGYEYLAGELFEPKSFLGQPVDIKRDNKGKILNYSGIESSTREHYSCDNCNKIFKIDAAMNFITTAESDEYTIVKYSGDRLFLKED